LKNIDFLPEILFLFVVNGDNDRNEIRDLFSPNVCRKTIQISEWLEFSLLHVAVLCIRLDFIELLVSLGADCFFGETEFHLRLSSLAICQSLQTREDIIAFHHYNVDFFDDKTNSIVCLRGAEAFQNQFGKSIVFSSRPVCTLEYYEALLHTDRIRFPLTVLDCLEEQQQFDRRACAQQLSRLSRVPNQTHNSHLIIAKIDEFIEYGVFATRNIDVDEFIGCYFGEIVRAPTSDEQRLRKHYAMGMELFSVDGESLAGTGEFHVDGERVRNILPFVNHSQTANCVGAWLVWAAMPVFVLRAATHIAKGEQLVYCYGKTWAKMRGIDERDLVADSAPGKLPGYLPALSMN